MAITYKKFDWGGKTCSIYRKKDGNFDGSIPLDPANNDYAEYLEWVADGNTPEESD